MNIFAAIRLTMSLIQGGYGHKNQADPFLDIVRRLDALTVTQNGAAQTVQELSAQQGSPTKRKWGTALAVLSISVAAICIATSGIVHISLIDGQAETLHERAQADRSQAIEEIVAMLAPFDQSITTQFNSKLQLPLEADNGMVTVIGRAEKLLDQADRIDMQADAIAASTAFKLYVSEIILVIGSAIGGGIISWAITQFLNNKRVESQSARAESVGGVSEILPRFGRRG